MRLLLVSQYFWPESFRINDVIRTLVQKGVSVDVLTGKPNYPQGIIFEGYGAWGCQKDNYESACVYRVPLIPRGRSGLRLAINYISFLVSGAFLAPFLLRRKKFDVIFVYGLSPILQAIPAIVMGKLKGCPVVLWVQDLWPASLSATGHVKNRFVLKLVELAVRYIYKRADLILVQSEAFIEPVRAMAWDTEVVYYPNSVDDSFSSPFTGVTPLVPGMSAKFPIVFAGNIGIAQAVEVIVGAADQLRNFPDIQFVVLGDGSRRQWMLEEVEKLGLNNVHLPGSFPLDTMPGFMQQAAALLVTLSDEEIFTYTVPSKVQAYLAAGRPILACLNGAGAELVKSAKAGIAVPAEDAAALAKAILALQAIPREERDSMGRNGAAYFARNFSHEMLVDRLIELLKVSFRVQKDMTE